MSKTAEILFSLIRFEVFGGEYRGELSELRDENTLATVCALAAFHDMAHLVADALGRLSVVPSDEKLANALGREQLKAIQGELGLDSGDDASDFLLRIEKAKLPIHVEEKLRKEVSRLAKTPFGSPEATVSRGYIETCLEIPFEKYTKDETSVKNARKTNIQTEKCKKRVDGK